jgi:hypothetical protein
MKKIVIFLITFSFLAVQSSFATVVINTGNTLTSGGSNGLTTTGNPHHHPKHHHRK